MLTAPHGRKDPVRLSAEPGAVAVPDLVDQRREMNHRAGAQFPATERVGFATSQISVADRLSSHRESLLLGAGSTSAPNPHPPRGRSRPTEK